MSSWSERAYADARAYLAHRARVVTELGPRLEAGDLLLDLACGDAAFADFLPEEVRYLGVDGSREMVAAALERGHEAAAADLNDYVPPEPVAVTTCFRAIYYADERRQFFSHVAGYTRKKVVFDVNPRQYGLEPRSASPVLLAAARCVTTPAAFRTPRSRGRRAARAPSPSLPLYLCLRGDEVKLYCT